jgi:hypothetical protein
VSRLSTAVRARSPIWWAVLAVAACGVVATAHGLYEVVAACGVLAFMAALYVPITDGLALVAYAATDRLEGFARAYAWTVVLLAAGLSGTAQAVMLGGLGEPPVWLRYVVGAWPALAVAIAAHLLWLVGRLDGEQVAEVGQPPAAELDELVSVQVGAGLDKLRTELLDMLSAKLDAAALSNPTSNPASKPQAKPVSKVPSKSVSKPTARSEDYREAVRRMLADGVSRSTASYRADAAEKAGTLAALLEQYPAVRPVEPATATA